MMKRKRRNRRKSRKLQATFRVPGLLASILVPGFVFCIIWLMTGVRCDALGLKIRASESRIDLRRKQAESEQDRWANLMSPSSFRQILISHDLDMHRPDERAVVRVTNSEGTRVASVSPSQNRAHYE